jgi:hypothetical protein
MRKKFFGWYVALNKPAAGRAREEAKWPAVAKQFGVAPN